MKRFNALLPLFLIFLVSACSSSEANYPDITQQQLIEKSAAGEPQLILDVRTAEEFAEGHVPGATNISHEQVSAKIADIVRLSQDRKLPIIVYCRSGHRAGIALKVLQSKGFTNVYHLEGDMNGWKAAKRPIEK